MRRRSAAEIVAEMAIGKTNQVSQLYESLPRLERAMKPPHVEMIERMNRMFAPPEWLQRMQDFDRIVRGPDWSDRLPGAKLQKLIPGTGVTSDALARLDASSSARLRADMRAWGRLSKIEELSERAGGFGGAAAIALGIGESAGLSASTVDRLLGPVGMLTRLGKRTGRLLEEAPPELRPRIARTLEVIEGEVSTQLAVIADGVSETTIDESELFAPDRSLTLGQRQQDEMLAADAAASDDIEALLAAASATPVIVLAREITELVFRVNQAAQHRGRGDVFKPTNRLLQAFHGLNWTDARTESSFGNVVDDLYFMLYEGAGKDKLRFLREHGGALEVHACSVIFCIKHLRNKWLRHDPEHGSERDIQKNYAALAQHLTNLGLPRRPRTAEDYRLLQHALFVEVRTFLNALLVAFDTIR